MQTGSIAYAGYWRNSLADAELGRGAFHASDIKEFLQLSKGELASGHAERAITDTFFAKESEQTKVVEVVIRTKVYISRMEHGKQRHVGAPAFVTPLVTSALLARNGRLYPLPRTVVPRDILEPLERGHFSIGWVTDQDAFLTKDAVPGIDYAADDAAPLSDLEFGQQWAGFLSSCNRLLEKVGNGWPRAEDNYELAEYGYIAKKESFSASRHIIPLYDHMRSNSPAAPLFDRYASTSITPPEPCLPEHAAFSLRLAHASNNFPLAPAQRHALTHLMVAEAGEILAVNGPPGTGKTTLLLSVVASLWAKAAMEGGEPPVILAASTNNQAVTNIIDAFGKDFATGDGPFAGRWLPRIKSFGAYFPAVNKEAEASEKYQTHSFFKAVESVAYVAEAQEAYLRAAAAAFPDIAKDSLDVRSVVNTLQEAIRKEHAKLTTIENTWLDLSIARSELLAELGETPAACMAQRRHQLDTAVSEKRIIDELMDRWESYLAREPLLYALLSWLPPVARKRLRLARLFLKPIWPPQHALGTWGTLEEIEATIKSISTQLAETLQERVHKVKRGQELLQAEQDCLTKWRVATAPLERQNADDLSIADCDSITDTRIRFNVFLLTTHYWEGRWLLDMQALLPDIEKEQRKNGRVALQKRWQRHMKLTPCIVSTFFMLPKEMQVSRHDGRGYVPDYLYDFADLLIVDEAGQVPPEVAGASFALSKKALVIGDTLQIEPIWSIPAAVDIGNLLSAKLLPRENDEDAYEKLSKIGKSVASGSVMQIAQVLTRYHHDPDLARGLFLYEHRRCFDEIISYCNALCYRGKLIPKRGTKASISESHDDGLPAMGYLHIDGICQKTSGGSRQNTHEAETIAAWLVRHKDSLEAKYAKPLHKIVGVITPFGGQVRTISNACSDAGIDVSNEGDGITVGTVHSLQGAEREVVIFSPVYSKHSDGGFIDRSSSMLNVAVSRAKNTFLVFGDMDVFELAVKTKPRGLLATYLFQASSNALSFECRLRQDLQDVSTDIRTLRDAQEHDAFLLGTLAQAAREVHIVTPWIIMKRMQEIGALDAMRAAVQRGISVVVYTDPELNEGKASGKRQALITTAGVLRNAGIQIALVERVHSKVLIGDNNLYCIGSFNWFSASRDQQYARHETSLVYRGPGVANEIEAMRRSIERRIIS